MDLTILVVGLILGVGIPLRNKAIKKRRENMKEKGNEEGWKRIVEDIHSIKDITKRPSDGGHLKLNM